VAIRNFKLLLNEEEIIKRISMIKSQEGNVTTYFPNQINIDKKGIYYQSERLYLNNGFHNQMIVVNIKEAPMSFQSVLNLRYFYNNESIVAVRLSMDKLIGEFFLKESRNYQLNELLKYNYLDYSKYLILILFSLIHYKTLDFSFFSICLTVIQSINTDYFNNVLLGLLIIPTIDSLLSINHKFNPVLYYSIRNFYLRNSINENNCLNRLFLQQPGKYIRFKITKGHIEEGETLMTKRMFCLIYFSGAFSKFNINSNVFSRLTWFSENNHNILKDDILKKLFDRQGYCKNFELFKQIIKIIDTNPVTFKNNLKLKNIDFLPSLIRLNYYLLLHLKGVYNSQTRFYNVKLIDFNYEKNKRVRHFKSSEKKGIMNDKIGDITVTKNVESSELDIKVSTEAFLINNTNNILLYKENCNKKYTTESRRFLTEHDKIKIVKHRIVKLKKFLNFLNKKLTVLKNEIKLRKVKAKIYKIESQIDNEFNLAKMMGLQLNRNFLNKKFKSNDFCIRPIDNNKTIIATINTVTRDSLINQIKNNNEELREIKLVSKKFNRKTEIIKDKVTVNHKNFSFTIDNTQYDEKTVKVLSEQVTRLNKEYKSKKLAKKFKIYEYFKNIYLEMLSNSKKSIS